MEDDPAILSVLGQLMELVHTKVYLAKDPSEALGFLGKKPKVVLVDLHLGVHCGHALAKAIYEVCSEAKIIFTTGDPKGVPEDPTLPVMGVLEKPFDVGALLELVKKYCKEEPC